jgi:hypothetical protein
MIILKPQSASIGERPVRTPNAYFTDVGILCYLVGLRYLAHAAAGPMVEVPYETVVASEFLSGNAIYLKRYWTRVERVRTTVLNYLRQSTRLS